MAFFLLKRPMTLKDHSESFIDVMGQIGYEMKKVLIQILYKGVTGDRKIYLGITSITLLH